MHRFFLAATAALALPAVMADSCCPVVGDSGSIGCGPCPAANGGNFAAQVPPPPAAHLTHTWTRINPSQVLASLKQIAQATPDAISLLGGHAPPSGGHLSSYIQPPPDCTSIPQDTDTNTYSTPAAASSTAAAYSTSPEAATAAASTSAAATSAAATYTGGKGASNSTMTTKTSSSSSYSTTSSSSSSSSSTPSQTPTKTSDKCTSPTARVEWRNMSDEDKSSLMNAIKCLMTTDSRTSYPGAVTRWDDLVAVHQEMAPTIHQVGGFLVWHRQFLWIYEQELRNTCKYTGAMPWWDETRDAGAYAKAPMMTAQYYGSAPRGGNQCLSDGSFKGVSLHVGPGSDNVDHCLSRGFNETDSAAVTNDFVNACNSYEAYGDMNLCQFYGPHAYTHDACGGSMGDVASSPNDPLFFLHHAFVDRNYRNWQLGNPDKRTYAIGGYTTQQCSRPAPGCIETTLNDRLSSLGFYPDVTIAQVADTQGGHLCYYYDS